MLKGFTAKTNTEMVGSCIRVAYVTECGSRKAIVRLENEANACQKLDSNFPSFVFFPLSLCTRKMSTDPTENIDFLIHKPTDDFYHLTRPVNQRGNVDYAIDRLNSLRDLELRVPTFARITNMITTFDRQILADTIGKITRALVSRGSQHVGLLNWSFIDRQTSENQIFSALKGLCFPIIVKNGVATGVNEAHDIAVAGDFEALLVALKRFNILISPNGETSMSTTHSSKTTQKIDLNPALKTLLNGCRDGVFVQPYIKNHGGVVYKIYVIGNVNEVVIRRSLPISIKSIEPGQAPIYLHGSEVKESSKFIFPTSEHFGLEQALISMIAEEVQKHTLLSVFGVDILRDEETNFIYVIDINFFPSFRDVPNAQKNILKYISSCVAGK